MIPTAEEFLQNFLIKNHIGNANNNTRVLMIEFAKLHVEAALKEASEKVEIKEEYFNSDDMSLSDLKELANKGYPREDRYGEIYAVDIVSINKDSILNAYPLTNIK